MQNQSPERAAGKISLVRKGIKDMTLQAFVLVDGKLKQTLCLNGYSKVIPPPKLKKKNTYSTSV